MGGAGAHPRGGLQGVSTFGEIFGLFFKLLCVPNRQIKGVGFRFWMVGGTPQRVGARRASQSTRAPSASGFYVQRSYLAESVHIYFLQKSTAPQIRQLILYRY